VTRASAPVSATIDEAVDAELTPERLFRAHARYVAAIAFRLLGRRDEVDDLVQDVFLDAHRSLGRLRVKEAAKAWLAAITVRKARRRLRFRRLMIAIGIDRDDATTPSREAGPYTQTLLAELFARLDRIPTNQRIAWTLRYLDNEPLDVVAVHCGCSLATAKRWITAASARLDYEEDADV
jgi:RNA polymerase sigma-70 factor (ECF subfamily)